MENTDNNLTITFKLQDPRKMCVFSGTVNNDQFWTNGFKDAVCVQIGEKTYTVTGEEWQNWICFGSTQLLAVLWGNVIGIVLQYLDADELLSYLYSKKAKLMLLVPGEYEEQVQQCINMSASVTVSVSGRTPITIDPESWEIVVAVLKDTMRRR